jgi:hypothetical protein
MSWDFQHECDPTWDVQDCASGYHAKDEWNTVRAINKQHAVERWAEESDRYRDYEIINGSPVTVLVRRSRTNEWDTYVVTGESVPSYSARRVATKETTDG